jgi:tetratricopeptide (TPR) repeat protein
VSLAPANSIERTASNSPSRRVDLLVHLALLAILVFAAYWPTLRNGFIWDDDAYVTNNSSLRDASGLIVIWTKPTRSPQYYPATFTTLWLEFQLWHANPAGYHLVNILFHLADSILLYLILRRLKIPAGFLAASIFAVHPIYVESVAWISELKNTQSTFFYLLAFHAYLSSGLTRLDDNRTISWKFFALSLVSFVLALLSKTVTSSLPAAILLVQWWKRGKFSWRDFLPLIPFFILGICLGLFTAYLEKHSVGAQGDEFHLSLIQRCVIAGRAIWFYAWKLICPANLTFIYPRWNLNLSNHPWLLLFPISAILAVFAMILLRNRSDRGPLTAIFFFVGTLFPALGFVNVFPFTYSFVADHFQYLASVGLIVLIASGLFRAGKKIGPLPAQSTMILLWIVSIVLSNRQCRIYRDSETLWRDTIAKNPASWMAELNLANALMTKDRVDEAKGHYLKSRDLAPNLAEPIWDLGVVEARKRNYPEAIALYRKAIQILPQFAGTYYDLGNALVATGQNPEAIENYRTAIHYQPNFAGAHDKLGIALEMQKQIPEAIAEYTAAIAANPFYAEAHYNLANCLLAQGDVLKATEHYQAAVDAAPNWPEAHANLGYAFLRQGRSAEADYEYRQALRLNPHLEMARHGLAALHPELP